MPSSSTRGRLIVLLVAVAVVALAALAFRNSLLGALVRARYPRIIVVTLDTLHVDHVGPYNSEIDNTPVLDRFAAAGVTFDHAYTTVPITLPSHASLLTGRTPPDLGVMVNGDVLTTPVETLAEWLGRYGYRTGAVTSLGVLDEGTNLAQGFGHYDDEMGGEWERWYRTADEVVAAAQAWVEEVGDEPFFLWLHLSDPHEPYLEKGAPPDLRLTVDGEIVSRWTLTTKEEYRTQLELPPGSHTVAWEPIRLARDDDYEHTALVLDLVEFESADLASLPAPKTGETWLFEPYGVELENPGPEPARVTVTFRGRTKSPGPTEVFEAYAAEIGYMDGWLGRFEEFLAQRGLADETLWAVVSDHGEGLFHFGSIGHATYNQEDQLRIVWVLKGPGVPVGRRIAGQPVLVHDVMPTILDLVGLPSPDGVSGSSQVGCWSRGECHQREEWWSYGANVADARVTALAGYRWPYKLLWQNRRRTGVFDVSKDPFEEVELSGGGRNADSLPRQALRLQASFERQRRALQKQLEERGTGERTAEQEEMLRALGYLNP
ncbi:MAG: sulfatase-like hydrolase/transferase [Thermoanaerobaculia bacterium]